LRLRLIGQQALRAPLILTVTALVITVAVTAGGSDAHPRASGGSSVLDRPGRPVTFGPREARFLHQAGFLHVYLLATRNRHDYYRLSKPHRFCYGVGFTALHRPGQIKCFLSDPAVFIDFSVAESSRDNPEIHLWRLQGMAHDGVVAVGMIGKSGQLLAKVPVREGIYYLASPPANPIGKIVAYDAHGHVLATHLQ
jgi:hypothetical protein